MITFLMPANKIPEGTLVRKPTGQKLYTLKNKIEIFSQGKHELASSIWTVSFHISKVVPV